MLVSTSNLLNIITSSDNKVLKDALKQADSKTLEKLVQNKTTSQGEILKNLFDDLKSGAKSNQTLENILKNSTIFKELGSFSKSLNKLMKNINQDPNLQKYKPALENFLKNVKDLDTNNLKENINKSGVFLESKLNNNQKTNLPMQLEKTLGQIQNILKNIDVNSPTAKNINILISNILIESKNDNNSKVETLLKQLLPNLQKISSSVDTPTTKNLSSLTNQLKSLINDASLVESKIENKISTNLTKENINQETKTLLNQIKNELLKPNLGGNSKAITTQIDKLLQTDDFFKAETNKVEVKTLINNLVNDPTLKQVATSNKNVGNIIQNLQNISSDIEKLESKSINLQDVKQEKNQLTLNLKENINNLKNELQKTPNLDLKTTNQLISKLENIQNIFTKVEIPLNQTTQNTNSGLIFSNNFASNLNNLFVNLKENIVNLTNNQNNLNTQNEIIKTIDNIETTIKENLLQTHQAPNNKANISQDMKSVLLQMHNELTNKNDPSSQETMKQIEKMISQVDYHQLNSLTSNSANIYVPFFWEMMEEGTLEFKKGKEDKFYCQINLSLKDNGKIDLMLALYDKNKLDLTVKIEREHFKNKIFENIKQLKQALNNVNLIPVNIKLLDLKETDEKKDEKTQKFVNQYNQNLGSSVDIRV